MVFRNEKIGVSKLCLHNLFAKPHNHKILAELFSKSGSPKALANENKIKPK